MTVKNRIGIFFFRDKLPILRPDTIGLSEDKPGGKLFFFQLLIILLVVGIPSIVKAQSFAKTQTGEKVQLIQAGSLEGVVINGEELRKLIGDVIFKHEGTFLYCDSAYQHEKKNEIECFGRVRMVQGDSINLTGKKLVYNGNTKVAVVTGEVVLKDRKMTLTTDYLEYNKELVQQNMQLNQYSYIISHNLRGPIVTLLGLTDVFERFEHDTKLQTEVIGHIKKSAIHLDNIIRDLNLILSNSENAELLKVDIDLEVEISIVKDLLKSQIETAHASIITEFDVKNIQSVRSYIQSILLNLMSNSLKYKKPDIPSIIKIKTEKVDSNTICISFSDNGLGFDLERNKDKIFGFYKRFHTHVEGKGLGLYLLKNQVEILKGKVEVESQINQGTTFRIFLSI